MTIRRSNPRLQGLIGLGAAIRWFCEQGYAVSIPLNDSQPYDLVVEAGGQLSRVQVKTTTCRNPAGNYVVELRTNGGNQSFHTTKHFDPTASDLLFVLADDATVYLIPSTAVRTRSGISLGRKYDEYRC